MDECRKALEKVERLACEALANPSDNDSKTLVAICTTVEAALAARTEAKVSGEDMVSKTILSILEPLTWNKNPYSSEEARDRVVAIIEAEVERRVREFLGSLEAVP